MERSFARGTPYGYDRARWRGLWRVQIQEYLVAAIQNIEVLFRYGERPNKSLSVKVNQVIQGLTQPISGMIKDFLVTETNEIMSLDFVRVEFSEI
jgi:hypothetical protein